VRAVATTALKLNRSTACIVSQGRVREGEWTQLASKLALGRISSDLTISSASWVPDAFSAFALSEYSKMRLRPPEPHWGAYSASPAPRWWELSGSLPLSKAPPHSRPSASHFGPSGLGLQCWGMISACYVG